MVDLILLSFTGAMFAAGFYCGRKFGTYAALGAAIKTRVKGWFA
jgi:hypothetical protein